MRRTGAALLAFTCLVLFQGCFFTSATAFSSFRSEPLDFKAWLATFDFANAYVERNSALCDQYGEGFHAFPGTCSPNYYACINGAQTNLTCPNSATDVFDPATGSCVPLENSSCKQLTTLPASTKTPLTCVVGDDGFFPISACSSNYYVCIDGQLYPQTCPNGGIYDDSIKACTTRDKVPACAATTTAAVTTTESTSTTPTTTPTPSTTTTESTTITTTPTTPTSTPTTPTTTLTTTVPPQTGCSATPSNPYDCAGKPDGFYCAGPCLNNYVNCVGGTAYNRTCPATSVFNGTICTGSTNVPECAPTTTSITTPTTTTPPTTTESTTTTQSTTTESTTTAPTTTTDQSTTTTSQRTSTTTPSMVTTAPSTSTAKPCPPSNITNTFNCPSSEGNYGIPGTCGPDYYVCVSCSPYVRSCPSGAIFDPVLLVCKAAANATCNQPFTCPADDGFYPLYPGSCSNRYYACVGGQAYNQTCPGNSIFDPAVNKCKAKDEASCRPTVLSSPVRSAACLGEQDGFYPFNRNECRPDYYLCISGLQFVNPVHQSCPASAVFDPYVELCMPTESASC